MMYGCFTFLTLFVDDGAAVVFYHTRSMISSIIRESMVRPFNAPATATQTDRSGTVPVAAYRASLKSPLRTCLKPSPGGHCRQHGTRQHLQRCGQQRQSRPFSSGRCRRLAQWVLLVTRII